MDRIAEPPVNNDVRLNIVISRLKIETKRFAVSRSCVNERIRQCPVLDPPSRGYNSDYGNHVAHARSTVPVIW